MNDKAQLIARIESAYAEGRGVRLSHEEIGLPMAVPQEDVTPAPQKAPRLDVQICWLIRRDMAEVLRIEQQSFEFSWTEEDFLCCLRQRNCIGMVAERDHQIVGFMIYELHKSRLDILNFAVARESRRRGVGTQMVQKLLDKLSQQRRDSLLVDVRESNLPAQLFFRSVGMRAESVIRQPYEKCGEDAISFAYRLHREAKC